MNIVDDYKIVLHSAGASAGTSTVTPSSGVDCQGFAGVTFFVVMGEITSGAEVSIVAETSTDNDDEDKFAEVAGSGITVMDTEDDKMFVIDVLRPRERYVRCVVNRSTQNSVLRSILAILYDPSRRPTEADANVVTVLRLSDPGVAIA